MSGFKEINLSKARLYPFSAGERKVKVEEFAHRYSPGEEFHRFLDSLPRLLRAKDLSEFVDLLLSAHRKERPVIFMLGAHLIKCGLSPILIDLMEEGIITGLATNGAGVIHDLEIALWGSTSEDVERGLEDGSFGMCRETGNRINEALKMGMKRELGFGEAIGEKIGELDAPYRKHSLFSAAHRLRIPFTVHIALGADIIHQHPSSKGEVIGKASLRDFRIFSQMLASLQGGVVINFGSAVILPEVFLKGLNLVRNLGHRVTDFTTANFDMYPLYRPLKNVVERPHSLGGRGFSFIGHHEIMLPLLAGAIKAKLKKK